MGENLLAVYVVLSAEAALDVGELRHYLSQRLPEPFVPASFLQVEALPRTSGGKVDRRRLPEPCGAVPASAPGFVAPRTPIEASLAQIWTGLLGLPVVGVHDSFLDLGGQSLLAIRLVAQIQQALDVEVPLAQLFEDRQLLLWQLA